MNNEAEQRKSLLAVSKFVTHWESRGRIEQRAFQADVRYWIRGKKRSLNTLVQLHSDGVVYVLPASWLNADDHYTQFNPKFQSYKFTTIRHALRIRGGSNKPPEDKMGGQYKVVVRPLKKSSA